MLEQYVSTECQCQFLMYFSKEYVMINRGGTNWDQRQYGVKGTILILYPNLLSLVANLCQSKCDRYGL